MAWTRAGGQAGREPGQQSQARTRRAAGRGGRAGRRARRAREPGLYTAECAERDRIRTPGLRSAPGCAAPEAGAAAGYCRGCSPLGEAAGADVGESLDREEAEPAGPGLDWAVVAAEQAVWTRVCGGPGAGGVDGAAGGVEGLGVGDVGRGAGMDQRVTDVVDGAVPGYGSHGRKGDRASAWTGLAGRG